MYREGLDGSPFHTMLVEGYMDAPVHECKFFFLSFYYNINFRFNFFIENVLMMMQVCAFRGNQHSTRNG